MHRITGLYRNYSLCGRHNRGVRVQLWELVSSPICLSVVRFGSRPGDESQTLSQEDRKESNHQYPQIQKFIHSLRIEMPKK